MNEERRIKWDSQTVIVVCTIFLAVAAVGTMIQTGFSRIDDRFDSVDVRIDSIDTRLDNIDRRLGRVEGYLFGLETEPVERL